MEMITQVLKQYGPCRKFWRYKKVSSNPNQILFTQETEHYLNYLYVYKNSWKIYVKQIQQWFLSSSEKLYHKYHCQYLSASKTY